MPLRRRSLPSGPDLLLYRRLNYGGLASFHVLDTRQYRTDQLCGGDTVPPCPVKCDITPGRWQADFRTVPYISRRGAPLNTRASFLIESGRAELHRL